MLSTKLRSDLEAAHPGGFPEELDALCYSILELAAEADADEVEARLYLSEVHHLHQEIRDVIERWRRQWEQSALDGGTGGHKQAEQQIGAFLEEVRELHRDLARYQGWVAEKTARIRQIQSRIRALLEEHGMSLDHSLAATDASQ